MASNILAMASNLVFRNIGVVESYSKGPSTYPCLSSIVIFHKLTGSLE